MNKELLEDRWVEIKDYIRERFSNLTDEDLKQINGHYDQLVVRLQQRYGLSKEEAEAELRKWMPERFSKPIGSETYRRHPVESAYQVKESEGSSFNKWLFWLGLPLMFLLGFFANQAYQTDAQKMATPVSEERTLTQTPQDQFLSRSILNSLATNPNIAQNIDRIRIVSSNGEVTVSGSVSSDEQRDAIVNFIQNIRGVTKVNNNILVR